MPFFRSGNESQPLVARALYDFTAERGNELSFSVGDELVGTLINFIVWVCIHCGPLTHRFLHLGSCRVAGYWQGETNEQGIPPFN